MDEEYWQRAPAPGWTRLRIGERLWQMPDEEWERLVRAGRVPPDAMVLSRQWSRGVWRRADSLEVFHLFRPEGGTGAAVTGPLKAQPPARPASNLPRALWGPGISATQVLILANLLISAALVWFWRDGYADNLWRFSGELRADFLRGILPVLLIPLFLHASSSHLLGNMVALAAAGAAVEEFYGPWRTAVLYLAAGLCGAVLSLLRVKPVLSVGASGAIMGLYGVILVFLLRNRKRFSERQKMKTARVYIPLLVLALFPSLAYADFYSHAGGLAGGILLGLLIPPAAGRVPWGGQSP